MSLASRFRELCLPLALALVAAPATAQEADGGFRLDPAGDLSAMLDCFEAAGKTVISAHRGGPSPGLPENAIETMDAVLAAIPAIMEVDIARSRDGVHFLMHDRTLDRTTNGTGAVDEQAWTAISELNLRDGAGWVTPYKVSRLDDALRWAKGRTVLQLDFKRSADLAEVIALVRTHDMGQSVVLIAHTAAQAKTLHELAPEMLISHAIDRPGDLAAIVAEGVPADRILAYTGTRLARPDLYAYLDTADVEVIFGTLGRPPGSIDAVIDRFGTPERYAELSKGGVDILGTDRPREAAAALNDAGRLPQVGTCGVSREQVREVKTVRRGPTS
jgi:glycerophosphoryl diester phosphodiesterase